MTSICQSSRSSVAAASFATFPDRTETDLYVWVVRHQAEIAEELGWEVAS
jgi:hypothetical protein